MVITRQRVWDKTGGKCWYCGRSLNPKSYQELGQDESPVGLYVIDHVNPKSRGGSSDLSNLVPCCWQCNAYKGAMLLDEYRLVCAMQTEYVEGLSCEQLAWLTARGVNLALTADYKFWGERA